MSVQVPETDAETLSSITSQHSHVRTHSIKFHTISDIAIVITDEREMNHRCYKNAIKKLENALFSLLHVYCTGHAKGSIPLKNFANFSRTIERYDTKF